MPQNGLKFKYLENKHQYKSCRNYNEIIYINIVKQTLIAT